MDMVKWTKYHFLRKFDSFSANGRVQTTDQDLNVTKCLYLSRLPVALRPFLWTKLQNAHETMVNYLEMLKYLKTLNWEADNDTIVIFQSYIAI